MAHGLKVTVTAISIVRRYLLSLPIRRSQSCGRGIHLIIRASLAINSGLCSFKSRHRVWIRIMTGPGWTKGMIHYFCFDLRFLSPPAWILESAEVACSSWGFVVRTSSCFLRNLYLRQFDFWRKQRIRIQSFRVSPFNALQFPWRHGTCEEPPK